MQKVCSFIVCIITNNLYITKHCDRMEVYKMEVK
nr:MAG TPA: hypothetical protein [Bacteriophage sp.]